MSGLEIIKTPSSTAGEIADIISKPCPPITPAECDRVSCRECWLAWLTTGEPPKKRGPSDKQTAPGEEGLHPNLEEHLRSQRRVERETRELLTRLSKPEPPRLP